MIRAASEAPIFWQFVGIGNESFEFLKKLDDIDERKVDNANFFALNNFASISDNDLYRRLLSEYPQWLELSEVKDMIANQQTKKGFFGRFLK